MKNFDERWGIEDSIARKGRAFNTFLNYMEKLREPYDTEEQLFYFRLGQRLSHDTNWRSGFQNFQTEQLEPYKDETVEFARRLEALLNVVVWGEHKQTIQNIVNKNSAIFGFVIIYNDESNDWETYPAGSELYDAKLVVEVAEKLEPKSKSEFLEALRLYKDGKEALAIGKSRRTIEELLREIMKNTKGLTPNIPEFKSWLTDKRVDPKISDYLCAFVALIDKRYNDLEKHNSIDHDEKSAEYFIYQTGVLARYILRIKNEIQ